nr:immunoglobulin light chain junction region [Macaca mulatta]
WLLYFIGARVF